MCSYILTRCAQLRMFVFRFVPRKCQRAVSGCRQMKTNTQNRNYWGESLSLLVHKEQVRLNFFFFYHLLIESIFTLLF